MFGTTKRLNRVCGIRINFYLSSIGVEATVVARLSKMGII
jgi:hypothetical protein